MVWLGRLAAPLGYLSIRHERKTKYDWYIPIALSAISGTVILFAPVRIGMLGPDGLITSVYGLVQILVGFFIAALAAIATFNRPDMDDPMVGTPPTIEQTIKGEVVRRDLSRRSFLCYLFGYLSYISLTIFLMSAALKMLAPAAGAAFSKDTLELLRIITCYSFLFIFWNMIVTTLIGLFYLTDRIHRGNTTVSEAERTKFSTEQS